MLFSIISAAYICDPFPKKLGVIEKYTFLSDRLVKLYLLPVITLNEFTKPDSKYLRYPPKFVLTGYTAKFSIIT